MLVLRRLYSRRSNSARYIKPAKIDPGIKQQKKIFAETREDVSEMDLDQLESDFTSLQKSHGDHVREMEAWREREKYLIVKRKYFKEKFPNFLTWHDKEQIRYLHNVDPEEWSVDRLSEGFPALPEVIEKIIRSDWTKRTQAKIAAHDRSVIQHWSDFKKGKLNNLPEPLKEHLQKFSNRSLNLKPFEMPDNKEKIIRNINEHKMPGEFSEIIASYQRLQSKNDRQDQDLEKTYLNKSAVNNSKSVATVDTSEQRSFKRDPKILTFKELQQRVEQDIFKGKDVSEQERLIVKETRSPTTEDLNTMVTLQPEEISKIVEHRHETNSGKVGFVRKTARDMSHLIYPETILIPKKHYKQGYTYKLNDCYYDCDGEFLYRVPGMS